MNSPGQEIEPDGYVDAVLSAYMTMPETPLKPTPGDRTTATRLLAMGVPLHTVHTALVLGSLRRLGRPSDYPRLQPVRSLAYFLPVIDELLETPVSDDYETYLRVRLKQIGGEKLRRLSRRPATVQKTTFLRDR
jgi:hypothetical protein